MQSKKCLKTFVTSQNLDDKANQSKVCGQGMNLIWRMKMIDFEKTKELLIKQMEQK